MWREVLKSKGFRLSKNNTEYIKCKFNKCINNNLEMKIGEHIISKVSSFDILDQLYNITHKILTRWMK